MSYISEAKEHFSAPESFSDIHLLVFIFQTLILFLFSLGLFYIVGESEPEIITDKGLVSSYFSSFQIEDTDKTFVELPSLHEDETNIVKTAKFLDKGGVWLSKKQECGIVSTYCALMPASIVFLFLGLGRMYKRLREPYFKAMGKTALALIFPPVGVAIWGMISLAFWFLVTFTALIIGPFVILLHLILGIIQIFSIIRNRSAAPHAA